MLKVKSFRSRTTYHTRSNQTKWVRTPGHRLVRQRVPKTGSVPRCPISGDKILGISGKSARARAREGKYKRTVSRPYGGMLSARVVRDKILRAFFANEKQCVQAVLQEKARAAKLEAKRAAGQRN